jgi:hypothetical protein
LYERQDRHAAHFLRRCVSARGKEHHRNIGGYVAEV